MAFFLEQVTDTYDLLKSAFICVICGFLPRMAAGGHFLVGNYLAPHSPRHPLTQP